MIILLLFQISLIYLIIVGVSCHHNHRSCFIVVYPFCIWMQDPCTKVIKILWFSLEMVPMQLILFLFLRHGLILISFVTINCLGMKWFTQYQRISSLGGGVLFISGVIFFHFVRSWIICVPRKKSSNAFLFRFTTLVNLDFLLDSHTGRLPTH